MPAASNFLPVRRRSLAEKAAWGLLAVAALFAAGCAHAPMNYDRRVLVLDFQNLIQPDAADQKSQLASSLADFLTTRLANHPRISVVERLNNPSLIGLGWQEAGRKAKVDYVIVGSLSKLNENYVVAIRLLSMSTGEVVKGSSVERSCNREEDLYPVVEAMSNEMARNIQILSERYEAWVQQPKGTFSSGSAK